MIVEKEFKKYQFDWKFCETDIITQKKDANECT